MRNTFVDSGPRASGRTTAICEAAKAIGATVVCATAEHARMVKHTFRVPTTYLGAKSRRLNGPFLFDHYAVDCMTHHYESKIAALQIELAEAKEEKGFISRGTRLKETGSSRKAGPNV